jgi:hypothetical protein
MWILYRAGWPFNNAPQRTGFAGRWEFHAPYEWHQMEVAKLKYIGTQVVGMHTRRSLKRQASPNCLMR